MKENKSLKIILAVGVLGLALSAHSNNLKQDPITLKMQEIPLTKIVEVFSFSQGVNVLNWKIVPKSVTVNVDLVSVPAREVLTHILRCGGLAYMENENGIELIQQNFLEGDFKCELRGAGSVENSNLIKL